jgi:hypothetical protein
LAGTIRALNGILPIILIVIGVIAGAVSHGGSPGYVVVGGIIGIAVALLACGLLALFIEIRSELIKIREALERGQTDQSGSKLISLA